MTSLKELENGIFIGKLSRDLTIDVICENNIKVILLIGDSRISKTLHLEFKNSLKYPLDISDLESITNHRYSNSDGFKIDFTHAISPNGLDLYEYYINDAESTDTKILNILPHFIMKINDAISTNKKVLICCKSGSSCSPFIILAYRIWNARNSEFIKLKDHIDTLEKVWLLTAVNDSFIRQLAWFQKKLMDKMKLYGECDLNDVISSVNNDPIYQKFLKEVKSVNLIIPNLYIGSISSLGCYKTFQGTNIRCIMRLRTPGHEGMPNRYRCDNYQNNLYTVWGKKHLRIRELVIDMFDSKYLSDGDITKWFPRINHLIKQYHSKKQSVLVHCDLGISRSAAVVMAYLIHIGFKHDHVNLFEFMRSKRSIICPNTGFIQQLGVDKCIGSNVDEMTKYIKASFVTEPDNQNSDSEDEDNGDSEDSEDNENSEDSEDNENSEDIKDNK
jgi:protein-tyrosine phosphatase